MRVYELFCIRSHFLHELLIANSRKFAGTPELARFGTKSPRVGHTSGSGRATYLSITYDPQAAGSLTYLSIKRVLSYHPYIVRKRTKR